MAKVAYLRVSTSGQNTERQLPDEQFDKVFEDKVSAKDVNRPELQSMVEYVREGDIVVVHSIDRLARNLADLESLIGQMNSKGVTVDFRKESLTFSGESDAMETRMLQMMGAFAQFERSMIRERQREGIAAAKAKAEADGKPYGRASKLSPKQLKSLKAKRRAGVPIKTLLKEFPVSRATLYRLTA